MTDFEQIAAEITRDNALALLESVPCPYCASVGRFSAFDEIANNGVGLRCDACGKHHPFVKQRIMWLRANEKRRSNDIVAVAQICGAYCYGCGATFEELEALGIGFSVHHTRRFADHGEKYAKIPYCSDCHEIASLMQRMRQRQLRRR